MDLEVRGRRVRAATGGRPLDPERSLLILLHGAGFDHTAWSLVMRAVAHGGFSVLAPDLPGHGKSEGPAPGSIENYASWVADLLEVTGFDRAHLAGHSMGSLMALGALPFVRIPAPAAWPFLLLSVVAHTGYFAFLLLAYRRGHLSQVYPLARGVAPVTVAALAAVAAGESLVGWEVVGVASVSVGIASLALGGGWRG